MTPALHLEALTKQFGEKVAVDRLDLALEPGAFLGLLGRNGAGKSTTLKMVTGLLKPTSGRIRVLGLDLEADPLAVKRQIGAMPEDMALLDMLTGPQYLRFVGRMYGLPDALIDGRREELFDALDLDPGPKTLIADYSFGMKKKVALCAALIHGPQVVFLDEPFEGIDPVTSRTIKDILQSLQQRGVTLVLTSHILEVVEKLCPLIAILDEGRLKGFGPLDELRRGGESLEQLFVGLVGGGQKGALSWL
ncbi:ABC transporter ATP-binding protein [Geothrix alkalitolerans]|uniref:ABC transporter ATP-binding protein n=1 Tax=Geothrix alkalitolerans TaxID=2922724 RepID=UPI001FAEE6B4|nr:ABC transporter ATP-binding protein [Geothrix alkalitolerans]